MKAVVFHGIGDIRLEDVPDPQIQQPTDAIVRLTATAICGTDLHLVRGTLTGMREGTIVGHEGVGVVEQCGRGVRNFREGERVVIASTVACGYCAYCRSGYYSQCDNVNPNGPQAGGVFFGGPAEAGALNGLQAERARIPFAATTMVKVPGPVSDDQALMMSDIFPTGYFGAKLAQIKSGNTVAVLGCGPVGQFAIMSAWLMNAGRVIAIDRIESRLEMAQAQGAEAINFDREDPVQAVRELTGGVGVDRVIDAVGIDADMPRGGPAAERAMRERDEFEHELQAVAPKAIRRGEHWVAGNAPSMALEWAVEMCCKAGTIAIIGVYPPTTNFFPLGKMMAKNLTVQAGNCNHRKYIRHLLELTAGGVVDPSRFVTKVEPLQSAIEAYEAFDQRQAGWMKVELLPAPEPLLV